MISLKLEFGAAGLQTRVSSSQHRRIGESCVPEFGNAELHKIGAIGIYPGKLGSKKSGEHTLMQRTQLNDLAKAGVWSRRPPNARFIQPAPSHWGILRPRVRERGTPQDRGYRYLSREARQQEIRAAHVDAKDATE